MLYKWLTAALLATLPALAHTQTPVPSPAQQAWQDMEFYFFVHFGPNTFTNLEWGHGNEAEGVFNPTALDCGQWARTALAAGAKGIIITAKHHDGFCLWPSQYSTHTVRESGWRNGQGDVLRELADSCKAYGLKFGVYISPWDRNHPQYGTATYNDVYINMMKELFTNYGPIWELWWDGANGEGPNGKKQVYDWPHFISTVRTLSPGTVVFSDVGPDIRWVGNESGHAGTTNWDLLTTEGFTPGAGAPSTDTLNQGNINGTHWIPAECDVSIRPGWFYHAEEDDKVKTPQQLFELYLKSVGRGANLLLNVPPNRQGRLAVPDSLSLAGFHQLLEQNFKHNFAMRANIKQAGKKLPAVHDGETNTSTGLTVQIPVELSMRRSQTINCIVLQEDLTKGQQCIKFKVVLKDQHQQVIQTIQGTTIGHKRILTFPAVTVQTVELVIDEQKAPVQLSEWALFKIDDQLVEQPATDR